MNREASRTRGLITTVMTLVVLTLLGVSQLSLHITDDYDRYYHGQQVQDGDDEPLWGQGPLADINERIRVQMGQARSDAKPSTILVTPAGGGPQRKDQMELAPPTEVRQIAEDIAAAAFAIFGLVVLAFGRDRASLWLGLFCASWGTSLFSFYAALPPIGMLIAQLLSDLLQPLGTFALFGLAEAVALAALRPADPMRNAIAVLRWVCIVAVAGGAAIDIAQLLSPVLFLTPLAPVWEGVDNVAASVSEWLVLCVAPLAVLIVAVARAASPALRKRAAIILATTAAALSGVIYSLLKQLPNSFPAGFDSWWFTLVLIVVGFIVTIRYYGVVEVKIVVRRILVVTAMTAIIGGLITASEVLVTRLAERMAAGVGLTGQSESAFNVSVQFVVAFAIVLSFSRIHAFLEEAAMKFIFRRRDEAVQAMHEFAARNAAFITERSALLQQAVTLVHGSVGAVAVAVYEECPDGYDRVGCAGDEESLPKAADFNDAAFVVLRSQVKRLHLERVQLPPSVLGNDGIAVPMAVGGRVIGSLVVARRASESDGPYVLEELEALEDVARGVADALFTLRTLDVSDFVRSVADGRLSDAEAKTRAQDLRDGGFIGTGPTIARPAAGAEAQRPSAAEPVVGRVERVPQT